jgi:hypothetical protein
MAPIFLTLFLLAVGGGGGWFLFVKYGEYQKRQALAIKAKQEEKERLQAKIAEEKARREAEAQLKRQAKLQKAYENAVEYARKNSSNPEIVKAYLLKMKKFFEGTEFEAKIDVEMRNLRMAKKKEITALIKELEDKAEKFTKSKEFKKAARVFADYTGDYEEETASERSRKASYYMTLYKENQKSFEEYNRQLDEVADALINRNYPKALALLEKLKSNPQAESRRKYLEETARSLLKLKNIDKNLRETLLKSKGKVIYFKTEKGRKIKGKVLSVGKSSFYIKMKIGKAIVKTKIKYNDLDVDEKMKLINQDEESSKLFAGLSLAQKGNCSAACEKYFAKSDDNPLFSAIFNKLQNPSKINQNHDPQKREPQKAEPAETPEADLNPNKLQLKAIVRKPKKKSGIDYDDKKQEIRCRVSLTNKNRDDANNLNVNLYIIGRSAAFKNEYRLLKIYSEQINIPNGENVNTQENAFLLNYDDNNAAKYGFTYEGYIIAVKNDSDKILKTKCSSSRLKRIADKIMKFQEDTSFDKAGRTMESSTPVYYN